MTARIFDHRGMVGLYFVVDAQGQIVASMLTKAEADRRLQVELDRRAEGETA